MRSAAATISVMPEVANRSSGVELAVLLVAGPREVLVAEEQAERGDDEQEEPREDGEAVGRDRAAEHGEGGSDRAGRPSQFHSQRLVAAASATPTRPIARWISGSERFARAS